MRLIVFDVDGTIVDSQHDIVEAQARAFAAHGLPAPSRAKALSVVGLSLTEAFAALAGADAPLASLAEAYKDAWTDIRLAPGYRERLYPGATETILALADAPSTRLGIATGKSRRGVDRVLSAYGWSEMFATIQTADDHPSKPHPAMLEAAMREVGVPPGSTAMIGDTTYDIKMATAAGAQAIGVAWGYHPTDDLRRAGAGAIVDTFAALGRLLAKPAQEDAPTDAR